MENQDQGSGTQKARWKKKSQNALHLYIEREISNMVYRSQGKVQLTRVRKKYELILVKGGHIVKRS